MKHISHLTFHKSVKKRFRFIAELSLWRQFFHIFNIICLCFNISVFLHLCVWSSLCDVFKYSSAHSTTCLISRQRIMRPTLNYVLPFNPKVLYPVHRSSPLDRHQLNIPSNSTPFFCNFYLNIISLFASFYIIQCFALDCGNKSSFPLLSVSKFYQYSQLKKLHCLILLPRPSRTSYDRYVHTHSQRFMRYKERFKPESGMLFTPSCMNIG
jgi:hypothetical protein